MADPAQIWGNPAIEDDLKLFGNFGSLLGSGLQFYGHTNYAGKRVTEGFYFRNPNNRANIYSLDGGETLLIGDRLAAQGMGSANCPVVRIADNVPDPAALALVNADPDCFSFRDVAPGRLHAAVRGRGHRPVGGRGVAADRRPRPDLGRQRRLRRARVGFLLPETRSTPRSVSTRRATSTPASTGRKRST